MLSCGFRCHRLSPDCSVFLEQLGGLAGINCHCQWGLTGLLGGIVIMLAAGQGVPNPKGRQVSASCPTALSLT
jgi:hypothetical protein